MKKIPILASFLAITVLVWAADTIVISIDPDTTRSFEGSRVPQKTLQLSYVNAINIAVTVSPENTEELKTEFYGTENGWEKLAEAREIADLLRTNGLVANFTLARSNEVEIPFSTLVNGKRYVVLGPKEGDKSSRLKRKAVDDGKYWYLMELVMMLHEMGHHVNGHTLDAAGAEQKKQELEADYFSGFMAYKADVSVSNDGIRFIGIDDGFSLEAAKEALNYIASDAGTTTHPPKAQRLKSFEDGWNDAVANSPKVPRRSIPNENGVDFQYYRGGVWVDEQGRRVAEQ